MKTKEVREFVDFLTKHDGNVVEISAAALVEVWNPAAKVVATMESDDKRPDRYLLTVYNADKSDIFAGGTLVSILPEQKTGWTSVTWANDYHHLRGFYYVQWNPGMWQGFVSVSLLTVLPPDVAIAD